MSSQDGLPLPDPVGRSPRNYLGWISIAVLAGLSIAAALFQSFQPNYDDQQDLLRQAMKIDARQQSGEKETAKQLTDDKNLRTELDSTLVALGRSALNNPPDYMAQKLFVAMSVERKRPTPYLVLVSLSASRSQTDRLFSSLYGNSALTRPRLQSALKQLPPEPFVYTAARVQALTRMGDKGALARLVPIDPTSNELIAGVIMSGIFVLSVPLWLTIRLKFKDGSLAPKGLPISPNTAIDADRLAIRAAQIFLLFIVLDTFLPSLYKTIPVLWVTYGLLGLAVFAGVWLLQFVPVNGVRLRLSQMGLTMEGLGRNVLYGILGFVAEFPIAVALAGIGAVIFNFLPRADHPISQTLDRSHSFANVMPIIFIGCVVAPFWEEIVFRGLIFPALARLLPGIVPALLVSSVLFASVHPQGIAIWMSLTAVGGMSCLLSYQTKSLVPSMVMHCCHNLIIFALSLLVG